MKGDIRGTCKGCNGFVRDGDPAIFINGELHHMHCGLKKEREALTKEEVDSIERRLRHMGSIP